MFLPPFKVFAEKLWGEIRPKKSMLYDCAQEKCKQKFGFIKIFTYTATIHKAHLDVSSKQNMLVPHNTMNLLLCSLRRCTSVSSGSKKTHYWIVSHMWCVKSIKPLPEGGATASNNIIIGYHFRHTQSFYIYTFNKQPIICHCTAFQLFSLDIVCLIWRGFQMRKNMLYWGCHPAESTISAVLPSQQHLNSMANETPISRK